MKSKLIKSIIACFIVGAIGVGGYYGYNKYLIKKPAVVTNSFITVTAKKMNLQVNVQGTGAVYAAVSKDIVANSNGELKDLTVKVGDTVKAGGKLFVADSDQLRQTANKAESDLQKQKLQLSKAKTDEEIALQNLNISDAQKQVDYAWGQVNKMTVNSPIDGVVVAENNSNGDSIQAGKAILTIMDPSSMKIKVSVDELDIGKIKQGQKAEVKFDAIKDKVYEGTVEGIPETGTTTNNVTTYDVTVAIKDPTNIKIGMNANVNILVENKENALVIPTEALVEKNSNKFVMVSNGGSSTSSSASGTSTDKQNTGSQKVQGKSNSGNATGLTGNGKLVQIKTGIQNENYAEVVEGLTEGQQVLITLPKTSSTNTTNNRNGFGGGASGGLGNFGGGMGGGQSQGRNDSGRKGN